MVILGKVQRSAEGRGLGRVAECPGRVIPFGVSLTDSLLVVGGVRQDVQTGRQVSKTVCKEGICIKPFVILEMLGLAGSGLYRSTVFSWH